MRFQTIFRVSKTGGAIWVVDADVEPRRKKRRPRRNSFLSSGAAFRDSA